MSIEVCLRIKTQSLICIKEICLSAKSAKELQASLVSIQNSGFVKICCITFNEIEAIVIAEGRPIF